MCMEVGPATPLGSQTVMRHFPPYVLLGMPYSLYSPHTTDLNQCRHQTPAHSSPNIDICAHNCLPHHHHLYQHHHHCGSPQDRDPKQGAKTVHHKSAQRATRQSGAIRKKNCNITVKNPLKLIDTKLSNLSKTRLFLATWEKPGRTFIIGLPLELRCV